MNPRTEILASGGVLFEERLVAFLVSLTGQERPRVMYIPTAGGDSPLWRLTFFRSYAPIAEPTELALFGVETQDIERRVLAQDLIVVGGGNTASMLAVWRTHGVDRALRAAADRGVVLAGGSAGGICWFEDGVTDSFGPQLDRLGDGLGFLPGGFAPHFDSDEGRRPLVERLVGSGDLDVCYAADDAGVLRFVGGELREVVAARPGAGGHRATRRADGTVRLERLPGRDL